MFHTPENPTQAARAAVTDALDAAAKSLEEHHMDTQERYTAWQTVGRGISNSASARMAQELREQPLTGGSSSDLRRTMDFTDGTSHGWPYQREHESDRQASTRTER